MKRAKTKKRLITILSLILGLVFALSVGYTFAVEVFNLEVGSYHYSTTTYAANQQYTVINDTLTNPIPFGTGAHNYEVAIQYSYDYDFDIRIRYSLSWTGNLDTNNVILNYADRDSFIVDNEYIYYIGSNSDGSVPAGSGTIVLFTGVNFMDDTDETYIGASLTIEIEEVLIYKSTTSYNTSHELYVDTEAGNAWLASKNPSSIQGDAYVLIYNKRADEDYRVTHPGNESAYYKSTNASGVVQSYRWAGGNRYYGGLSAYIITGSQPVTIRTSIVGTWVYPSSTPPSEAVSETNIKYNYSQDWTFESYQENGVFENRYYNYIIPANSTVYIEFIDSIEITSRTIIDRNNYSNYYISTTLTLNGNNYPTESFTNGILSTNINTAGTISGTTAYSQSNIEVTNTGVYQPGLYDVTLEGSQTFDTNINLTNNTANKIMINSVTFRLKYTISNAQQSDYASEDFSSSYWCREVNYIENYSLTALNISTYLPAYTTINILDSFSPSLINEIVNDSVYAGRYDAWVEIEVTNINYTTANSNTTNNLSVEASASTTGSTTTITYSVKNKSSEVISNITANLSVIERRPVYSTLSSAPNDWLSSFWKYYYSTDNGQNHYQVQSSEWSTSYTYYDMIYSEVNISISGATYYNGFTASGSSYTSSSLSLFPNESARILSFTITDSGNELLLSGSASGQSNSTDNGIGIVNENTQYAYIINNSTNSYYVRFSGTVDGSVPNIEQAGGYNYYIGIVRPGQLIRLNMSGNTNVVFNTIQAGDVYTTDTLASWGSTVQTWFENYFR